ncbi:MAG TPA: hypothetical protein VMZ27_17155 [Candidatus Saccharimonadales bacterium]|nr:hypothetical protein [Candidatus Saccharimonadales bacterium]
MFAGHLGAALILKRADRGLSLGTLFLGAMLLDVVLWILVLFGFESVKVPANYKRFSDITFVFPYSHSLLASVLWAAGGYFVCRALLQKHPNRLRAGLTVAAAISSHFLLDWLVHPAELPLAGNDSVKTGLGLWRSLPLAWAFEGLLMISGLWAYTRTHRITIGRLSTLIIVMVLVTTLTFLGQASTAQPPDSKTMAASSLMMIGIITGFGWWLDRK